MSENSFFTPKIPTRRALQATLERCLPELQTLPFWELQIVPDARRGEFSSPFPAQLAAKTGRDTLSIGQTAASALAALWPGHIETTNGRLNLFMSDATFTQSLERATREGAHYGAGDALAGQRILVEYVSSDPTGPLPFSAGRHAAWGEALCRLLENAGARVSREFYLNDLTSSSKLRSLGEATARWYLRAFGQELAAGDSESQGVESAWVRGLGGELARRDGGRWLNNSRDELIGACAAFALEKSVEVQKSALEAFGTHFDEWVKESDLHRDGQVERTIAMLRERGHVYEADGATWLRTTTFGDEADRVLKRSNGQATYFAADVALHAWKAERGFDRVINIWGSEHRTYIPRTRAALGALGVEAEKFEFITVEGAVLERDGAPIRLGLSGGPLILSEEVDELGSEALKWGFTSREASKTAVVDLEVALRDDESNPTYAAQLLPSRLATLRRQLEGQISGTQTGETDGEWAEGERELARLVALWPETVEEAAVKRAPEKVAAFASQLAKATRELLRGTTASMAPKPRRLELLRAAGNVAASSLKILGIDARERF